MYVDVLYVYNVVCFELHYYYTHMCAYIHTSPAEVNSLGSAGPSRTPNIMMMIVIITIVMMILCSIVSNRIV